MLTPLSRDDEVKLAEAVSQARLDVQSGEHPTAAMAKIARDGEFGVHFTKLAVQLLNIQLNSDYLDKYRKDGEKRAASFPVADADEVLKLAAEEPVVEKAAFVAPIYKDYSRVKAAAESYPEELVVEETLTDEQVLLRQIPELTNKIAECRQIVEASTVDEASAGMAKDAAIINFLKAMNEPGAYDFITCAKEAVTRHGEAVVPVLKALQDRVNPERTSRSVALSKQAASDLDRILDMARQYSEKAAKATAARKDLAACENQLAAIREQLKVAMHREAVREKFANFTKGAADPKKDPADKKTLEEMSPNPSFVRNLQNIRRQSALARMFNDPVIGSGDYTPDDVYNAYTDITGLTPDLADNYALLMPYMRQYLESSANRAGKYLAPHEIQQLGSTLSTLNTANRPETKGLGALGKGVL